MSHLYSYDVKNVSHLKIIFSKHWMFNGLATNTKTIILPHKKTISLNILLPKFGFITGRFLLFGRIFKNYFYIAALAVSYSCNVLRRLEYKTLLLESWCHVLQKNVALILIRQSRTILDRKFLNNNLFVSVKKKERNIKAKGKLHCLTVD